MHLKHTVILFTLLFSHPGVSEVIISDFDRGLTAIEMGNPQRAYELWLPLAEAGDPNAQFGISMMFMDGIGVQQDFDEAVFWLFKAADQGFPPAQFHLGNVYERGIGRYPDIKRAIFWWKQAADKGMGAAQYRLGQIYWDGEGVSVDRAQARKYFQLAKANGEIISSDYRAAIKESTPAVSSRAQAPEPKKNSSPSCVAWLNEQPASGYTIQLIAATKQSSITYFIKEHQITGDYTSCAYRERDKDWFGLFYGSYSSRDAALAAIKRLPASLQGSKPYPRTLSTLRKLTLLNPKKP